MKILFMGTPDFALIVLEQLIRKHEIVGLFCQPDKPFGRKQELKTPATKVFMQKNYPHIPIFQPDVLGDDSLREIKALNFDAIVVVAYGKILPQALLQYRCLNIHASILPQYRGASPLQSMLLSQDPFFGVSVMQIQEGVDRGAILGLSFLKSTPMKFSVLAKNLAKRGADLLEDVLDRLNKINPLEQNHILASYCKKIKKEDGEIKFENAMDIVKKSCAYEIWPHIFLKSGLKLFDVKFGRNGKFKKGEILEITKEDIEIGCCEGSIRVAELQFPGKQRISSFSYANGRGLKVGAV